MKTRFLFAFITMLAITVPQVGAQTEQNAVDVINRFCRNYEVSVFGDLLTAKRKSRIRYQFSMMDVDLVRYKGRRIQFYCAPNAGTFGERALCINLRERKNVERGTLKCRYNAEGAAQAFHFLINRHNPNATLQLK